MITIFDELCEELGFTPDSPADDADDGTPEVDE